MAPRITGARAWPDRQIVAAVLLLALPSLALAEEGERRWSVAGATSLVDVEAFSVSEQQLALGGGIGLAWGLVDAIDVGADLRYMVRPGMRLDGAVVDGLGGGDEYLEADLHLPAVLVGGTYSLAGRLGFGRIRPTVGLGAAMASRILSAPRLVDAMGRMIVQPDTQIAWLPSATAKVGLAYRVTEHVELELAFHAELGPHGQTLGVALGASRLTYGD